MTFFDIIESLELQSYIMYIITIIAIVIYIFLLRGTPVKRPRLVWVDKSRKTKAFRNKAYGVSGKPDCIYKLADGYRLVEFKSRKSGIYESDRVQAKAAALAARGGSKYKITEILIQTKSSEETIQLNISDEPATFSPMGRHIAKLNLEYIDKLKAKSNNLILVSAITPTPAGEGKTTMALALTQNLVGLGKKVLLVEGDIRRRVMTQYVKRQKPAGLVSVLSGKTDLETTVTYDELLQADVLLGEETAVNGADLFSSEAFAAFVRRARELYDYVIIDTPPVLVVPDARIIAQQADAVVFVVKWDSTTKTQVRESLTMFERVNCPVSGLVLNNISARGMKRYGYGGNYGAYAAYGNKYYIN